MAEKRGFLKVKNKEIVDSQGVKVILKGVNLGGWLMMEGYILGGRNIPEHEFKSIFSKRLGKQRREEFERAFYSNFIREIDFKNIKDLGFNCVRVPFNYRILEDKDKIRYLEEAVEFCDRYNLWVILDMHSAPGAQNPDWHSDSSGKALLWIDRESQDKFINLWENLALIFKDRKIVAGYDILNEPVCKDPQKVLRLYKKVISAIRRIDKEHIIFLEGNYWAQDIKFLAKPWTDNLVYSIHFYVPLDFTFGFIKNLKYPGKIQSSHFYKTNLRELLLNYYSLKEKYQVPIYVGEFGQQSRCPYCGKEFQWLKDVLNVFKEFGFSWTYWTYKAVAGGVFPDGIFQYLDNPHWINRPGIEFGWETYFNLWRKYKDAIISSWRSENFKENRMLTKILQNFLTSL